MAASFRIDTMGGHAVEAKLASLVATFGDLSPMMRHLGGVLETQVTDRFESETAPDGSRWKPSHRVKTEGGNTLRKSGIMKNSIHSVATGASVEIGTNIIYAGVHQQGAKIRAKTRGGMRFQLPGGLGWRRMMEVEIPARPFLGLSADNGEELLEEVEAFVVDEMGGDA